MADYVITKVRFNKEETHITELLVNDEGKAATRIEQRSKVIEIIGSKKTYRTQPSDGKPGANVQAVKVGNAFYLRTDANETAKDNLGNLPIF